ncbi:dynein axonemal intermediate chain 4-like [Babylonia areolata]|uniref:dynein axonemal intermediate chain 4-like n=1 Tax=Babylonia areolata TaxID=304850 RepID=UPI003FD3112A
MGKVFDEAGVDVTPLPLLTPNQTRMQSMGDASVTSATPDLLSQFSTATTSAFGGGPFTRSVFSQSDTAESVADDEAQGMGSTWANICQKRAEVKEELTDEDLNKEVTITLEETDTIWLLDNPTLCVVAETKEAEEVALDNALYEKLCKSRAGNDLYAERGMNTFNDAPKFKSAQTDTISYTEVGTMCTNFDMYDTYAAEEEKENQDKEGEEEGVETTETPQKSSQEDQARKSPAHNVSTPSGQSQTQTASKAEGHIDGSKLKDTVKESMGTITSTAESTFFGDTGPPTVVSNTSSVGEGSILKSESLKHDLFVMERVINLNTYQPKQAVYRGFAVLQAADAESKKSEEENEEKSEKGSVEEVGPNLARLWSYTCHLTKGHNVACMAWSKTNPDLLAVGYGQFEFTAQKSGLICCWCLKNPEYPERIYTTKVGVTALDFSEAHPKILAAGFYDGRVALYNLHSTANEPLLDSHDSHTKHMGPVWQMEWIEKERGAGEEKTEVLISVSTDGHVMQWSIRKGFECYDIMRLKKLGTPMGGKPKGKNKQDEALIARFAGGLCFDFDVHDHSLYLVGTEEGYIHKCSCSYNEQYLETYTGHTGPVYRVRSSPFLPTIFLSCSADWSLCLWHEDRTTPILTFHSTTKQVPDLCWSPRCSTVFACVNEGSVEVWDLAQSVLDPVISVCPTMAVKLSAVTFGKNTECILVGDSEGQVAVYDLRSMPPPPPMKEQASKLSDVINASLASQMCSLQVSQSAKESGSSSGDFDPDSVVQAVSMAAVDI